MTTENLFAGMVARARSFLTSRKRAYQITFDPDNQHAQAVLRDLAHFCRSQESTFHPDARVEGRLDGRREVWLRITQHLKLSVDDHYHLLERKELP